MLAIKRFTIKVRVLKRYTTNLTNAT